MEKAIEAREQDIKARRYPEFEQRINDIDAGIARAEQIAERLAGSIAEQRERLMADQIIGELPNLITNPSFEMAYCDQNDDPALDSLDALPGRRLDLGRYCSSLSENPATVTFLGTLDDHAGVIRPRHRKVVARADGLPGMPGVKALRRDRKRARLNRRRSK